MTSLGKIETKLPAVTEAKVGKGRLLISTLNLGKERQRTPAQGQMIESLLARAGDLKATPKASLTATQLDLVLLK